MKEYKTIVSAAAPSQINMLLEAALVKINKEKGAIHTTLQSQSGSASGQTVVVITIIYVV